MPTFSRSEGQEAGRSGGNCGPPRLEGRQSMQRVWLGVLLALLGLLPARALELVPVTRNVWAIVGEVGQRTPANLGNNATFGAVVTEAGIVLIDPGATMQGAHAIAVALKQVSDRPVIAVINTGGQDHRWLGNAY